MPIDPILRSASAPSRTHVMGDISVCPKTATLSASGKVSFIAFSTVSEAGAAPQLITRNFTSRGCACCAAQTACHWAGTKKIDVMASRSHMSSICSGSNAPSG
ncbi:Uncharacterised protein [Mycobacteroides abscessus subsp. abscessus]|nr:Uncharacterised protein [Mycobacteroides abscessus subsp. abscessus]